MDHTRRLVVAITGASGAPYALRFLDLAANRCDEVYVMLTEQAAQVIALETGRQVDPEAPTAQDLLGRQVASLRFLSRKDYFTPPASGSFRHDGMVVIPCSMGTAGRIANGVSDDLITRAADVCLKEGRNLVLVPRETPLNLIHLRNLTRLAEAGATILPAAPAFYNRPATIDDLVDHVASRILQVLQLGDPIVPEWQHADE